jgi:hypothetical protein
MNLFGVPSARAKLKVRLRLIQNNASGRMPTYGSTVYRSAHDLPEIRSDAWSSHFWIQHVINRLKRSAGSQSTTVNIHESNLISAIFLASVKRLKSNHPVSIFDLGGGWHLLSFD